MDSESAKIRRVAQVVAGQATSDGAGVNLMRMFPSMELDMLDPFLMLDNFSSNDPDDYLAGFPPHPHRGFETVTYLLHGNMRHKDSAGHEGVIRSGGVQWMTAGSGIEHSEMPEQEDGWMSGFQLWVNLPASQKMIPPRYQEFEPEEIPVEELADGTVIRVIAGTTLGGTPGAVTQINAQPIYFDVTLPAGTRFQQPITPGHNAFLFLIEGGISVAEVPVTRGTLAILGEGDSLQAVAGDEGARFLLIAGKPLNEPVARSGPFVMNSEEELRQAYADYRAGKFGHVAG
ncbi:MAG: pirin family protein [Chromatiales bacterium]|nr:pirin family protein [Chromatiales bacterium]